MQQIGRPTGLIAYDTDINIERRARRQAAGLPADPRRAPMLYAAIIAVVGGVMLYALATRGYARASTSLHDRNPLFVTPVRRRRAQRLHRALPQQAPGDRDASTSTSKGLPRRRVQASASRRPRTGR